MDFLELFNKIAVIANPNLKHRRLPASLDESIKDTDIDSLDATMISVYLCDVYGISQKVGEGLTFITAGQVQEWLDGHKTQDVDSVESALERVQ